MVLVRCVYYCTMYMYVLTFSYVIILCVLCACMLYYVCSARCLSQRERAMPGSHSVYLPASGA